MKKILFFLFFSLNVFAEPIEISNAVVRLIPPVSKTTAMFFSLNNNFDKDIKLKKITSEISDNIEIHMMKMDNGKMEMRSLPDFTFKSHETNIFKSGSNHIMIFNLKKELKENEIVKFKFIFDNNSEIMVDAIVKSI